jgi:D-alanyl-D-alanine carboxypeptidase
VATANRGSRRLIVVVLGARSGAERTLKAAALFDRGFADGGWGGPGTLDTLPISYTSGPPDMRNSICGPGRYRGEEEAETASQTTTTDNPIFALFSRPQAADWDVDVSSLGPLGPRAASTPIPVFVGRTPGSEPEPKVAKQRGRAKTATAFAPDQAGESDTAEGQRALKAATKPVGKAAAKDKGKAQAQAKPHGKDKATGDAAAAKGHAKAKAEGKPAAGKPTGGKPAAGKEGKSAANKTGPTAQSSR